MNIRNELESLAIAGLVGIVYNPEDESETYTINGKTVKYTIDGRLVTDENLADIERWIVELENQSFGC